MARLRPTLVRLHRWLGLSVGLLFAVASATGAILVFQDDLDRALFGPPAPEATPGRVPVDDAVATILAARPGAELLEVDFPPARDGVNVYRVTVTRDGFRIEDYVDAGSGERVFWRPLHPLLSLLRGLHGSLSLGEAGRWTVMAGTAAGLLLLVLGLLVWWPRGGRWRAAFRIRWDGGTHRLNHDLHQVTGLLALPLLIALSVTGLLIGLPAATDALERMLHGPPTPPLTAGAELESGAPVSSYEVLAERAAEQTGGTVLRIGPAEGGGVLVRLSTPSGPTEVVVDPAEGWIVASRPLGDGTRFDADLVYRLHVGEVGGVVVRGLLFISSAVGFLLLPTGVVIWWIRRRRRLRRTEAPARSRSA